MRTLLRWLGVALLLDGLLSALLGKSYVRLWRSAPGPLGALSRGMLGWPFWAVRLGGVAEAVLGLRVLAAAPLQVRQLYHYFAPIYDASSFTWRERLYPEAHAAFDRALAAYLPPGGRVLDLGCGTAANLERILALGLPYGSYTGVDLTPEMLAVARQKFGHLSKVSFRQLDLLSDPLPEGEYDLIISTWVFSHLTDPRRVVETGLERLKPGGHMVLLFLSRPQEWPYPLQLAEKCFLQVGAARPVAEDVWRSFPGRESVQQFGGGELTMMVLRK
ncbi:MAG: class I SAM-dependent methyltransferase [Deinococcus sp.]|nr:class I SAM-dependent methyltransferase [Deinococcus sp.]